MNIGMFTDTYYPQINGLVTSLKMLEKEMAKRGHRLFIFTTTYPSAEKEPNVFRCPSISFKMSPSHRVAIMYPPRLLFGMRRFRLDVVHTHSEFPMGLFGKLVSEVYRKPIVHTYHTLWEEYVHYFGNSRIITKNNARRYSRIFCNGVDAIIAPTEKTETILRSYGIKKDMAVIPTGIDFEPFKRSNYSEEDIAALKTELGIPLDSPVIVNIGRIAKEKSVDRIIRKIPELVSVLPKLKMVIVGEGPALDELKALAGELGVSGSVLFLGSRPWSLIGKYYQLGDAFVSASTSETQGLTYVEAIAAGVTAVLQRDESSSGVVIDGETGFCFDGEDDMTAAILRALGMDADRREDMRAKACERISELSAEKFAENIEAFYLETIQKYKARHRRLSKLLPPLRFRIFKAVKNGAKRKEAADAAVMNLEEAPAEPRNDM